MTGGRISLGSGEQTVSKQTGWHSGKKNGFRIRNPWVLTAINLFPHLQDVKANTPSQGCVRNRYALEYLVSGAGSTTGWVFYLRQVALLPEASVSSTIEMCTIKTLAS